MIEFFKKKAGENIDVPVKGVHEISVCDMRTDRALSLSLLLEFIRFRRNNALKIWDENERIKLLKDLFEEYKYYLKKLHNDFLVSQKVVENIVVQAGNNIQAQILAGTHTYTGTANYCAIGTGITTPAYSDVNLTTESQRQTISGANAVGNVTLLGTYFGPGVATGTWQEYGFFVDGTASANSGQLWNHFLQVQVVTALQSMNVESTFTFINS